MSEVKSSQIRNRLGVWQGEISDVDPREYRRGTVIGDTTS